MRYSLNIVTVTMRYFLEIVTVTMRYFLNVVTVTMRYSLNIVTVTMCNLFHILMPLTYILYRKIVEGLLRNDSSPSSYYQGIFKLPLIVTNLKLF